MLPHRMHFKHGAYYRVARNKWQPLGERYAEALQEWARLEGSSLVATTVAEACTAYLRDRGPELAPKTLRGYQSSARRIIDVFGHLALDRVTRPDIAKYLKLRSAAVSANRDRALLSAVYSFAIENGWFDGGNPCRGVRRRPERPRRRIASPDEARRLFELAPPIWKGIILTGLVTGMRPGEIRALRRSDLTAQGIELRRPKTGAESLITWSPALVEAVQWGLLHAGGWCEFVFPSRTGGMYSETGFSHTWRDLCDDAGLQGLNLQDLRRTAATAAENDQHAGELLGHIRGITGRVYRVRNVVRPVR